jgi:hypothetical protein
MRKLLTCSGLALLLSGLFILPVKAGSEPVGEPDSSFGGDTYGPNNIIGLIQRLVAPIRGATATVSDNGRTITISIPGQQIQAVLERLRGEVRLQIAKYSADDADTLQLFASGATLADVLQQAIATLQQTDPARAARVQALLTQLQQVLANLNSSAPIPSETRLLVAANLDEIQTELLGAEPSVATHRLLAQNAADAELAADPEVVYEPAFGGQVVGSVQEHNKAVSEASDEDAVALASNTSFIVIADILEQSAGELRGKPIPREELESIDNILAAISGG